MLVIAAGPIKLPQDQIPAVPVSDSELRTKTVGLTIAGKTIQGLTLDSLAVALVRGILTQLSNTTVKWINDGFHAGEGGPQYVTDLKSYLQNAGDAVAGSIIQANAPGLCSPFQNVVKLSLIDAQAALKQANNNTVTSSCRLSQVSSNINNFLAGDFVGSGGWDAWFVMTQDPSGNPYSSYLNIQAQIDSNTASAIGIQNQQLSWNKGFLSTQDCTSYVNLTDQNLNNNSNADAPADSPDGTTPLGPGEKLPSGTKCVDYGPVKTPGDVIEAQLEKTFGSQIDQLNLSNDFNSVIVALAGQLQAVVFNSAKGIFDSTPNTNTYSGGVGGGGNSGVGVCSPSADTYVIGDTPITWTFNGVPSNGATFVWAGDEISGTTTDTPTVAYTTEGIKTASVTFKQSFDGGNSTTTSTASCVGQVTVSKYPPLSLFSCSLTDVNNKAIPQRVRPGTIAVWHISIAGGSGLLNQIDFDEAKDFNVTSDNVKPSSDDFLNWNVTGLMGSGVPTLFGTPLVPPGLGFPPLFSFQQSSGPTYWLSGTPLPLVKNPASGSTPLSQTIDITIPVGYKVSGDWNMAFQSIRDADPNVAVLKGASCPQSVNVDKNN